MQSLCLSLNEDGMATRNDHDQNKAADEAARTARTVTDEAARVGERPLAWASRRLAPGLMYSAAALTLPATTCKLV